MGAARNAREGLLRIYLKALVAHEELLGQLYSELALAVPRHRDLWERIAAEEHGHAKLLARLEGHVRDAEVDFTDDRARLADIQESMDFVHRQIVRVRGIGSTPKNALALGLRLERQLVERQFMSNLVTPLPGLQEVFEHLAREGAAHYARIEALASRPPRSPPWVRRLAGALRQRLGRKGQPAAKGRPGAAAGAG